MQKKEASFSRVTIFCLTKVVTRFTQLANKDAQITCRAHVIRPSNLRAVIQTVPLNHVWTVNFMVLHFHVQVPRNSLVIRKNYESFKATNKPVRFDL